MATASAVLFVRDVDLRGEGLLLRRAVEADAVREFVVHETVLRVGAHFLAVDEDAQLVLFEAYRGCNDVQMSS